MGSTESEPIAIVGLSCKLAGDASSPEKLWKMLAEGRSAWSKIPSDRFNATGAYHPNNERLNSTHVQGGHFMEEDVGLFDAAFFNYSTETAATLDPQFRLQLESVYEALENAGMPLAKVAGTNTSVFAGTFMHDYRDAMIRDEDNLPRFFLTGVGAAMASNRISHFFDLRGASLTIDTGCSTTLVALHQAVQSLRSGDSDMSIVGGSNIMVNPDIFKNMGSFGFFSPDGKCFAFDHRANGYGRGEGVATLVIKRLKDAVAAGDPIRAVIRETSSNQDGKTETLTSPSEEAQIALMRECYAKAGLDPLGTQYFEAHGTGTAAGDPIEASAIAAVFQGHRRTPAEALRVGSVKTNIGHTEATSGLASVIKVVLAMENGKIPPSINFEKPNPKLALEEARIKMATELEKWPAKAGAALRASVNNFGYGGANAHAIVEHVSSLKGHMTNGYSNGARYYDDKSTETKLLILSAKDEQACKAMTSNLRDFLLEQELQGNDSSDFLDRLVYTLGQRRTLFPWVATHPVPSNHGLGDVIKVLETPKFRPTRTTRQPRIGMVFTGQGAQWYAMGRELITSYPVFKESLETADKYLQELGADWSLLEELHRDAKTTRVNGTAFSIPICAAVQISLIRLLDTFGIRPTAVTSHSSGEIAAAYTVGAIGFRLAMGIAYYRSKFAADMTASGPVKGAMIAVGLGKQESGRYLKRLKCDAKAVVACVNSPASTTVAGDIEAVNELETLLQEDGVFARRLRVETAYHSHHMKPIANDYRAALRKIASEPTTNLLDSIAFSSPVTGYRISDAQKIAHPDHWVGSLLQPVQFVDSFTEMVLGDFDESSNSASASVDIIVEVGPHTALGGPIQEILNLPEFNGLKLPYYGCLVRHNNATESIQALAANLVREGYPLDVEAVNFPKGRGKQINVLTNLPSYPWNHQTKHWFEPRVNLALRERGQAPHDLLGLIVPGTNPEVPVWRHTLRASEAPWMRDHVIQSNMLYPGCGFICLAIEAVRQQLVLADDVKEISGYQIRDINVLQALVIPDTAEGIEIQTVLRPVSDKAIGVRGWKQFEVFSVTADNSWSRHAQGLISVEFGEASTRKAPEPVDITAGSARRVNPVDMWNVLKALGVQYGPTFKNIGNIIQSGKDLRSTSTIVVPDTSVPNDLPRSHIVHPGTLDAAAQAAFTALPGVATHQDSPRVFQSIEKLWISNAISHDAGHSFQCHTQLNHADAKGIEADVVLSDDGTPVVEIRGLVLQSLGRSATGNESNAWEKELCSKIEWERDPDLQVRHRPVFKSSSVTKDKELAVANIRQVCLYFIKDAVATLSASEIDGLHGHRAKFYSWMIKQVKGTHLDDEPLEKQRRVQQASQASVSGELICRLGPHLADFLRGKKAPEDLIEDGLLEKYLSEQARSVEDAARILRQIVHKNPRARILEIGASIQGTAPMLQAIGTVESGGPLAAFYHFTNPSDDNFENLQGELAPWSDVLAFDTLDIEKEPSAQGFELDSYDVVLANQVLSGSSNALGHTNSLIKSGGKLLLIERTRDELDRELVLGLFPEWWEAENGKYHHSLDISSWDDLLKDAGFNGVDSHVHDSEGDAYTTSVILSTVPADLPAQAPASDDIVLVTSNKVGIPPSHWLESLQQSISTISSRGAGPLHDVHTLESSSPSSYTGKICVFLGEMDRPLLREMDATSLEAIKAMTTGCKGLLWVTRGGSIGCEHPDLALATGFLRTLRNEYLGRPYLTLDLDPHASMWSDDDVSAIVQVLKAGFSSSPSNEFEYAVRDGVFKIPRIIKDVSRNSLVSPNEADKPGTVAMEPLYQEDRPLRMHVGIPGLLDTLAFGDDVSIADLAPEMVEVEPRAYGVNFRDVMVAMGQLHERVMGLECAGIITRIGNEAASRGYAIGDRVFCLLRGPFGSRARTEWTNVMHMPSNLSFDEAASLPVIFCTAYIGLVDIARMQPGQTVLIHAAAGGVGQSAIMMARHLGVEIFATVGTPEKRNLVKTKYGIPDDHIFSSRDTSFAGDVLAATNGRGVDAVVNSLAGPLLQESFNVLAPFGHFIEIGKRDLEINSHLEMRPFTRQVSFTAFYLLALMQHKPNEVHRVLGEIAKLIEANVIAPVHPVTSYPIADVSKAFRLLQTGKHMGKVVLSVSPDDLVPVLKRLPTPKFSADASYLLVGGVGGIGRSICHWMVANGAKNLVILSRSAGRSETAAVFYDELRRAGCRVKPVSCNVSNEAELSDAVLSCSVDGLPPIRGVIQAAMVLQDTVFEQMTLEQYETSIRPKVHGTWNLHKQFSHAESLDFFVILSSVVGVGGNVGQANYSAAGSYQDALARWRVSRGLPAVSIDLGAVKGIGVAEEAGVLGHLKRVGYEPITEDQVLSVLGSAILSPNTPQVVVGLNTGPGDHWDSNGESQMGRDVRFTALKGREDEQAVAGPGADSDSLASRLSLAASAEEAAQFVGESITEKLSDIFMIPTEDIKLEDKPSQYGIDSLVAVELRNMLIQQAAAEVSIFGIMQSVSLAALAADVASKSSHVKPGLLKA